MSEFQESSSEISEGKGGGGIVSVEELKNHGNTAFKDGNFELAKEYFTRAIEQQEKIGAESPETKTLLSTIYLNRSLSHASNKDWIHSAADAQKASQLNPKYTKAHFRLVRAFIELGKFKEARQSLSWGFKECGENKDFKTVEEELFKLTGVPVRPKPNDFEVIGELGTGNYTQVYKAELKATKEIFAIKVTIFFVYKLLFLLNLSFSSILFFRPLRKPPWTKLPSVIQIFTMKF
jgi:tetratricopeptide (TPR) repeat protein